MVVYVRIDCRRAVWTPRSSSRAASAAAIVLNDSPSWPISPNSLAGTRVSRWPWETRSAACRDAPDREQHEATQAQPEQDEQDRGDNGADGGDHEHPLAQRLRVGAPLGGEIALGGAERRELGAQRVQARLALGRGREHALVGFGDQRLGVVGDVGGEVAVDARDDAAHRRRAQLREPRQTLVELFAAATVGLEKAPIAGQQVAADAGLEVDDDALELERLRGHLTRGALRPRRGLQRADGDQHRREHARDDDRDQAQRGHHRRGETTHTGTTEGCSEPREHAQYHPSAGSPSDRSPGGRLPGQHPDPTFL